MLKEANNNKQKKHDDRNQDTGNQDKHYAHDHEVPTREPRAPLCLFEKPNLDSGPPCRT